MTTQPRTDLIKQIEQARSSRLIAYITGDRQPFATKIADDIIPIVAQHLEKIGKQKLISLFLYTRGGDMIAPIRLIKLIRSYAQQVEVIIPYRAHSAGTLIAIGADKIVMGPLGELSPVDPSTGHPFNPKNPNNQTQGMEISVEDLNSYFLFAKEKAGVKDEQMVEIYKALVEKIHPLAIGNIYRAARMARQIVEKLLLMHLKKNHDQEQIKKICNALTQDICIHGYPITRDEALDLGLSIENSDEKLNPQIWDLYENYAKIMLLNQPFNPVQELQAEEVKKIQYVGAAIESATLNHEFIFSGHIRKLIKDNQATIDVNIESSHWKIIA